MGKYSAVIVATCAAVAMGVAHPAAAQTQPPAAVEPVGAALAPVFDEVSPCGNISLALAAGDLVLRAVTDAVGGAPAPVSQLVAQAYAQAFLALTRVDVAPCTLVPPTQVDTRCDIDNQVGSTIGGLPIPSGLPLPIDPVGLLPVPTNPAFVGAFIDVISALGPAGGVSDQLADPLGCKTTERTRGGAGPALGGAGGGVDLTRPATSVAGESIDAAADGSGAGTSRTRAARSQPGPSVATETNVAGDDAAVPSAIAAPKAAPAASQRVTSDARRNVYRALAVLLGGAAAWGFFAPHSRRRPA